MTSWPPVLTEHAECWHSCYSGNYDLWCPDAYAHPAKMSPALCYRIMAHLEELDLLREGDTILDFMGGIGTTGIIAALKGHPAILVELEPKFVDLIGRNIEHVRRKHPGMAEITVIQGDSRNLSSLLAERGLVAVCSPPYQDVDLSGDSDGINRLQKKLIRGDYLGRESKRLAQKGSYNPNTQANLDGYGSSPGQIGNLRDRPLVSVVSPPYEDSQVEGTTGGRMGNGGVGRHWTQTVNTVAHNYGSSEGQIGQEKAESYLGAMSQVYSEAAKVCDVIAVVTKNPTRAGKLRRLDIDTKRLLEEVGFEIICHHKAMLFEELEQGSLLGGSVKQPKGRLSFFKRLSYQKGSPVAQWEDVLIGVKGERVGRCVGITSPPYQDAINSPTKGGIDWTKAKTPRPDKLNLSDNHKQSYAVKPLDYGIMPGQIGRLK